MSDTLSERGQKLASQIMTTIEEVRAKNHACTAREVSRLLKITHTVLVSRLIALRDRGLVTWTDLMGSLRVTESGRSMLDQWELEAALTDTGQRSDKEADEEPIIAPHTPQVNSAKKSVPKERVRPTPE